MLQVDYLVVAEASMAANNRHYIHGAIDVLWASGFPVIHPALSIALRLRVPWNDANTPFSIEIDLVDPDEQSILPEPPRGTITMGRPPTAIPGEDGLAPLVYNLAMLQFRTPGTHAVVLRVGGAELQRARFQVRLVQSQQPAPAPLPPALQQWERSPAPPPLDATPPPAPPPASAEYGPLANPPHLPFSLGRPEPDLPREPEVRPPQP
ncbi:MAG TPA: hypothetical protein VNL71_25000 [Chloroflexota bacterium]|nr:hypothetical protein [Chloroflexota bacterium]